VNGAAGLSLSPTTERDMLAAGIDVIPDKKNLAAKRAKRGECPTCGAQTHKVALFGKHKPLTIVGHVRDGSCLACHPIEGYMRRPPPTPQQQQQQQEHAAIPRTLEVEDDDDFSMVSGITMDMRLIQGARNWSPSAGIDYDSDKDEGGQAFPLPQRRPGPEGGPYADSRPHPAPPRTMPSYAQSMKNLGRNSHGAGEYGRNGRKQSPLPTTQEHPRFPTNGQKMLGKSESALSQPSYDSKADELGDGLATKPAHYQPGFDNGYKRNEGYDHPGQSAERLNQDNGAYHDAYNAKPAAVRSGVGPALDAYGYPIANNGYGWDKQNDLLPPGGMSALFKNRTGAATAPAPPPQSQYQLHSAPSFANSEIQFDPASMAQTAHSALPTMEEQKPPPVDLHIADEIIPAAEKRNSVLSGPMYQPVDFPTYFEDNGAPMAPRLTSRPCGPAGFSSLAGDRPKASNIAPSSPMLQAHKSTVPGMLSRQEGRPSDPRMDSRYSTGSQSTFAPPLRNRALRGRPDDDMIQDPMSVPCNGGYEWNNHLDAHKPEAIEKEEEMPPSMPQMERAVTSVAMSVPHLIEEEASGLPPSLMYHTSQPYAPAPSATPPSLMNQTSQHYAPTAAAATPPSLMSQRSQHYTPTASAAAPSSLMNHTSQQYAPAASAAAPSLMNDHTLQEFAPTASGGAPSADRVSEMFRQLSVEEPPARESNSPRTKRRERGSRRRSPKEQTIHDIPIILCCLTLKKANANMREKALRSLSKILWKSGETARGLILEHKGIDAVVKAMWEDIGNAQVQDAAADFLLALAASTDALAASDVLSNEESFCDSLLFAMQMHASVQSVQLKGCGILACLAAASSNNNRISDGTLSGALMMVLNAMSNHGRSMEIQKAGLQALYSQCALSANAESNKRSLMESRLDNGCSGVEVILGAMQCLQDDIVAMEWVCKMCWCLTSSEDLAKSVSGFPMVMGGVMQICQRHLTNPEAAGIVEASFGVIGNLAHVESNRAELLIADAIPVLIEGMRYHRNDYGVNIEACSAIANLAVSSSIRDSIVKAGGVEMVVRAMQSFIDDAELVGEAARAMVCMAIHSQESKEVMAIPEIIDSIAHASSLHQDASLLQEMSSALIASLAVGRATSDVIIQNGGVDVISWALSKNPEERVQDAALVAYRNLSCQVQDADPLLQKGMVESLVKSMQSHENRASIQMNACCSLWNLAFKTQKEPGRIVGSQGIKCIVKAMQSHMESGDLLELACGALWSLVDDSMARKQDAVGNGAIDAVACAVVMHPTRTSTLEKACGVLSNVSYEGPLAEAIANAQGVSVVVEAMRNNGTSVSLLEVGCIALRNIVFEFPDFAQEASAVISTILNAMRDNTDAVSFQQEACSLLWVLAAEAESCQSKILALEGMDVLMRCLDHNSHLQEVQKVALGAITRLTRGAESGAGSIYPAHFV
jgi:hypothetical protein